MLAMEGGARKAWSQRGLVTKEQGGTSDGSPSVAVRPQVLIYNAFDWKIPNFAHVSLILAADKSKLSKRHGATSVGEFREQGCLASAMVNFLSLLGWNDGTEQEIFTPQELQDKFSLGRINKSAAVFDRAKLVSIPVHNRGCAFLFLQGDGVHMFLQGGVLLNRGITSLKTDLLVKVGVMPGWHLSDLSRACHGQAGELCF